MTMLRSMRLGDCTISSVIEYSAPTHDPAFLFPDLPVERVAALGQQVGGTHYVPALNRLVITIQLWVVRTSEATVLIDAGVGNLKPRGLPRMNQLNGQMLAWLAAAGAAPTDVTHVLHTHLHGDHVGWNTSLVDGAWRPTFPNARHVFPRRDFLHYEAASRQGGDPILDASFEDSVRPLMTSGQVALADPGDTLAGRFVLVDLPGHSPGHAGYALDAGHGARALFCGDVLHSPIQVLAPEVNTSYCFDPERARATRLAMLRDIADTETLVLPMHFGLPYCGTVRRDGTGFRFDGVRWDDSAFNPTRTTGDS